MTPAKFQIAKNQKEKALLTVMVAVFLIGGYFYLLIRPALGELMELVPKVSSLRRELAAAKNLINSRPVVENHKNELDQKIKEFERIFPREREIPKLLEKLSKVAGESGVKIIGIKPIGSSGYDQKEVEDIYQAIPIEIIASSGYHELGKFLQKLETGYRFFMIKDLEISTSKSSVKRHDIRLVTEIFVLTHR